MELQITQTWHPKVFRTDRQTDGRTAERSGPTTRPAFAKATQVKIVSEYDQEIPQSQTADNLVAPQGRAAQP